MKSNSTTATILALIMLLLVLSAAFIFLFQGRQTLEAQRNRLEEEMDDLQQSLAQTELDLQAASATRTAVADALATAESNSVLLEGQLVQSQQEVNALTTQLDEASSTITSLQEEREEVLSQPPQVAILAPANGARIELGAEVNTVIVATDPKGITAVDLSIANAGITETYSVNGETLFTAVESWTPAEEGAYGLRLEATNSEGIVSRTALVTVTVSIPTATFASRAPLDNPDAVEIAQIAADVSDIRGLDLLEPIALSLLTQTRLDQYVAQRFPMTANAVQAQQAGLVWRTFDFIDADFDVADFVADAFSERPIGFYDPEANAFFISSSNPDLGPAEEQLLAQEFVHVLQDQHYEWDRYRAEAPNADAVLALSALVRGEAALVQQLYAEENGLDAAEVLTPFATAVAEAAPEALADVLLFSPAAAAGFAQALYAEDGFVALAAAWSAPPQSTEQVLHPERYLDGEAPRPVSLPDLGETLGSDWSLVQENVLGEYVLRRYLGQQLNDDQVETAASGWGGDRYAVYRQEETDELMMVLRLAWDTAADSVEFAALYPNYPTRLLEASGELQADGSECWQGEGVLICLYQQDQETTIIRAPDRETAVVLADALNLTDN